MTAVDHRARRRTERRERNRTDILDAAEKVFGEFGVHDGSIRKIAEEAGFSAAALYLFFENKQQLLAETLSRRGEELVPLLQAVAAGDGEPMEDLHAIVDTSAAFFAERPHFARMLRSLNAGGPIIGPVLAGYTGTEAPEFADAMTALATIVAAGQRRGSIRDGDPLGLAHVYSVLVNEYVLGATDRNAAGRLDLEQFHAVVDGALRAPPTPSNRRR
jgi:AcrR family transcriptional regulator